MILADQRLRDEPMPMPAGRLLFRRPIISPGYTHGIRVLDNTNFRRDVWCRHGRLRALWATTPSRPWTLGGTR